MTFYFSGNVADQNDVPVVGADVYVYADGYLADLVDAAGSVVANPVRSTANGFYEAFVKNDGEVKADIYWGGRRRYIREVSRAAEVASYAATALAASGPNYANTAAGLAATTNGQTFAVDETTTIAVYRRDAGPVATFLRRYPKDVTAASGSSQVGFVQPGTGAATRNVQAKLRETVSPEDFGAIGDGSLHPLSELYGTLAAAQAVYPFATALTQQIDYCAIVSAINAATYTSHGAFYHSGPEVRLRNGAVYRMGADTIQLKKSVRIRGAGSGLPWTSMAALQWAAGATGIIVHRFNTIGAGVEGSPTTGADGTVLEGFRMIGAIGTADAFGGHGVWLRARAVVRDVYVQGFTANGINVVAQAGGGGALEGNANCFQIHGGRVQDCGGHGVYTAGADANAGVGTSIDVTANRLWGIWDSAFLGNSWFGCHTDSNGVEYSGATPVKSAYASFGGVSYHAVPGATEAQLRTTQPGTDRTRWRACTTTGYAIAWTGSNPTGTYRQGGGYYSDNANASSLFSGCYSEGGQGLTWLSQNSLALGGSLYVCPVETGVALEARQSALWSRQGFVSAGTSIAGKTITVQIGGVAENGATLRFTHSDDTAPWSLNRNGGDWAMMHADTTSRIAWRMTGELTAEQFGSGVNQPYVFGVPRLGLGSGADARRQTTGTAAPVSGAWGRGEIVWNVAPSASGKVGWVCVTAGTPGTWKAFGPIDA